MTIYLEQIPCISFFWKVIRKCNKEGDTNKVKVRIFIAAVRIIPWGI